MSARNRKNIGARRSINIVVPVVRKGYVAGAVERDVALDDEVGAVVGGILLNRAVVDDSASQVELGIIGDLDGRSVGQTGKRGVAAFTVLYVGSGCQSAIRPPR